MSDEKNLQKQTYRHEAIKHRDRIDPGSENSDAACDLFLEAIKPQPGQVVALYWPKGREFSTAYFFERLPAEGIDYALPVIKKDSRILEFALWREGQELVAGPYGIMQPAVTEDTRLVDPDIVIVPMLAFDTRGNRLGYGGGYYDATLEALRAKKQVTAVGLAYAQQAVLFKLPHEPHDQQLDWVITPLKAHYFGKADS